MLASTTKVERGNGEQDLDEATPSTNTGDESTSLFTASYTVSAGGKVRQDAVEWWWQRQNPSTTDAARSAKSAFHCHPRGRGEMFEDGDAWRSEGAEGTRKKSRSRAQIYPAALLRDLGK
nr:hypothetical protein CFP56_21615 [Quercus suber]